MRCINCNSFIRQNINFSNILKMKRRLLCDQCLNQLETVSGGCIMCGKKTDDVICGDCKYWETNSKTKMIRVKNHSLFYYNAFAKELINKIKFTGDIKLIEAFKDIIRLYFKNQHLRNIVLIPVPMHEIRLKERGFNQSIVIAKCLPYPILNVVKRLDNEKQSKKSRRERIQFNKQYELVGDVNVLDKTIMIIDDLYTTGATIHKVAHLFVGKTNLNMLSFTLFRS